MLNADETGHRTNGEKRWLWTFVAATFVVYRIAASRGADVLQAVLGETFAGILGSDRLPTYLTYVVGQRQFCWAHVTRNLLSALDLAKTPAMKRFCREALALPRSGAGRPLAALLVLYSPFLAAIGLLLFADLSAGLAAAVILLFVVTFHYGLANFLVQRQRGIDWTGLAGLPVENATFLKRVLEEHGLSHFRVGIMESPEPNASTFGSLRRPAIVVTTGLLNSLEAEEVNAVLAHEIGHIVSRDYGLMVLAAVVPMLFFTLGRLSLQRSGNEKVGAALLPLAVLFFALQFITRLIVFGVSRSREYLADAYAAATVGSANPLASALYEIAIEGESARGRESAQLQALTGRDRRNALRRSRQLRRLEMIGVGPATYAPRLRRGLADGAALQWELRSRWARFFEFGSTHPLTAMRIQRLCEISLRLGQVPAIALPSSTITQSRTVFVVDLLLWAWPVWVVGVWLAGTFIVPPWVALVPLGGLLYVRSRVSRPRTFPQRTLGQVAADHLSSPLRGRSARILARVEATVEGNEWSRFVLRDDNAVLDVKLPILAVSTRSALLRLAGQDVWVQGWHRRASRGYFEIDAIEIPGSEKILRVRRSWGFWPCVLGLLFAALALIGALSE